MTHRLTWADFPPSLRSRLCAVLGEPVGSISSCVGGFSRSSAEVLHRSDGSGLFVKAVRETDNAGSMRLNRSEAAVLAGMPRAAPVPALVEAFAVDDWFVLVTEAAPGKNPVEPWDGRTLDHVLSTLDALQRATTPCPLSELPTLEESLGHDLLGFDRVAADQPRDLDPWVARRVPALQCAARRGIVALAGETLCHSDLRADNILVTDEGRTSVVDWAWASRGSRVADALQLLSSVEDPDGALGVNRRVDAVLDAHGLPRQMGSDVFAGILGFFVDAARWPHDPDLPLLGAHRARKRDVLLALVKDRWTT